MCDYSLHAEKTRLATECEQLVVHRFRGGTVGLAPSEQRRSVPDWLPSRSWWLRAVDWIKSPSPEPPVAVCIPPGAILQLDDISSQLQERLHVGPAECVTFTQTSLRHDVHRDAVRFGNQVCVSLQELTPGQRVTVLSLRNDTPETLFTIDEHREALR